MTRTSRATQRPAGSPEVGAEIGSAVGSIVDLVVGNVAHGGHFVARHHGVVVFVRHALPGERVRARITRAAARYLTADAIDIQQPSAARVPAPCPYAGPGRCGGCDFQHVALPAQRALKAEVVREQLQRLAGLDLPVVVEPVPGDEDGLRWRTRVELAVGDTGRLGLRRHHSHDVVALDDCLIATRAVIGTGGLSRPAPANRGVDVVAPSVGEPVVVPLPAENRPDVPDVWEEVVTPAWRGRFQLSARGFWQVHPGAAATFVDHVLTELRPQPAEHVLDLYAGAGLFARALGDAVGERGSVTAVESDAVAAADAEANLSGLPRARVRRGRVDRVLRTLARERRRADLVVLDPPRTGAGRRVVQEIAALRPRQVAYVACDPASLARDLGYFDAAGYPTATLRAFDAFPMTHHVECIAILRRAG